MALTTKIGGVESDSFVTVAEADVIIPLLPDDTDEWDDLEEQEKEYRLQLGAALLALLPLKGRRVYCRQGLAFPRTGQSVVYSIPVEVKETQVYLSYSVAHRGLAQRPSSVTEEVAGSRVSQVSLGGLLSVSFSGEPLGTGTMLEKIIRTANFPAFLKMQKWLSQVRGRSFGEPTDADAFVCSTTSTTTSTTSITHFTTTTTITVTTTT